MQKICLKAKAESSRISSAPYSVPLIDTHFLKIHFYINLPPTPRLSCIFIDYESTPASLLFWLHVLPITIYI